MRKIQMILSDGFLISIGYFIANRSALSFVLMIALFLFSVLAADSIPKKQVRMEGREAENLRKVS